MLHSNRWPQQMGRVKNEVVNLREFLKVNVIKEDSEGNCKPFRSKPYGPKEDTHLYNTQSD